MARYLKSLRHAASGDDALRIRELLETVGCLCRRHPSELMIPQVEKDLSETPQPQTPSNSDVDSQESRAFIVDDVTESPRHMDVDSQVFLE